MKARESAFRKLGFPAPVIKELVLATEKPGTKTTIVNGNRFATMLSKGGVLHRDVVVAFKKPPIKGMEFAAPAEKWQTTYRGVTYTVYLPEVCFNWSMTGPPLLKESAAKPPSGCVELAFNAPVGGKVRWGVGTTSAPLPPDACNAQRQDEGPWTAWYGECDECIPALAYVQGILGGSAQIPHRYVYPATHVRQTLRFSPTVWASVVYICLEHASGSQTCGVYTRPADWRGRYRVELPDTLWRNDDGHCPS